MVEKAPCVERPNQRVFVIANAPTIIPMRASMDTRSPRHSHAPGPLTLLAFLGLFAVMAPTPAYCYIDPLSGSVIFQVLVASFLAAAFTLRRFWMQVTHLFRSVWQRFMMR